MSGTMLRVLGSILFATCFATTLYAQTSPTSGPLRVHQTNPRYFADATGRPVYLTGSHVWHNLQDGNGTAFNYSAYLDQLRANNHNFIRLWTAESPQADVALMPAPGFTGSSPWYQKSSPLPYARTGPGIAADGSPKFNLTQFDQAYFDRLRARVIAARDRGIYVSIMLFNFRDVWNALTPGRNVWRYHPYNTNNNVNGINGDPNGNGNGEETHTLQLAAVTQLQSAYVKKVVDTVNDLNNVIFEISNADQPGDPAWQSYMATLIRTYEAGKASQHTIGMTGTQGASNAALLNSTADWLSFAAGSLNNSSDPFIDSPPATDGTKVSLLDTDHLGYAFFQNNPSAASMWVWKSFLRGHNPALMEDMLGSAGFVAGRSAMGHTRSYAARIDLASVAPRSALSTTGYCLASPGREYLAYQPGSGSFSVDLVSGTYTYEWFNPTTGAVAATGTASAPGGPQTFTPPFSGPAVLYLTSTAPSPSSPSTAATIVGQWTFEEGTGLTTADLSGNGFGGSLINGPEWTTGKIGSGLRFDGINDYVHIPNSGQLSPQKMTLSLWAKPATFANTDWSAILASVGTNESSDGYYGLAITTAGQPIAILNIGGGAQNIYYLAGPSIAVGQWHHLAMTYDNATLRLYVNGTAAGQSSINQVRTTNASPLVIGKRGDSGAQFNGALDDVRIYSRILGGAEVSAIMADTSSSTTQPPTTLAPTSTTRLASATTTVSSLAAATTIAPTSTGTPSAVTYQASADFSGVQGQRNWFYLDSLGNRMTFNATNNTWQGAEAYLALGSSSGHPGATRDAVRRWVAPNAGTIQLTGRASDGHTSCGGGVTVSIRKGAAVLWQQSLANGNTTGIAFALTSSITAGEAIDFVINRGSDGGNACDTTVFDPTISFSPASTSPPDTSTPPPTSGTATVTLSWTKNTEPDLSYYRVYYGTSSRNYSTSTAVGNTTSTTISNLTSGQIYYFALTAVDTSGNQSAYSQEVSISR
ncbi:MAG: Fibronectin type-III domain-containing protein [Nitrospira sp.]|nr:MAG: Fibronectin type-III domain-containing protein [Nitrospira sp.]